MLYHFDDITLGHFVQDFQDHVPKVLFDNQNYNYRLTKQVLLLPNFRQNLYRR